MNGSKPGELSPSDFAVVLKSAGWTLLAAIAAAALTALADTLLASTLPELRDRGLIDVTLFTLLTAVIDAVRKAVKMWLTDTRMVGLLAFACLVLAGPLAMAEEVAVLIDGSKPGTYLVEVAADGSVSARPLRLVRPNGSPSPPTDPDNPTPGNTVEARAQSLTAAAIIEGGTSATAAKLSVAYSAVAEQVATGNMPIENIGPSLKLLSDTVIPAGESAKWVAWRAGIGDLITNRVGDKDTAAATLRSVSSGTKRAVDGAAQISGNAIDWGEIFKMLLPLILKLIEKWLLVPATM